MIALIVSSIFVLLFNLFFFKTNFWGLGFGLLIFIINGCFFVARQKNPKYLWLGVSSSLLAVLFGFLISFRSNELVQVLNLLVASILSLTSLYFYKLHGVFKFKIIETLLAPLETVARLPEALIGKGTTDVSEHSTQSSKRNQALFNGLLISIPVVGILLFLLMQADPIFGKLTQNFLSSIFERALISFILFMGMLGFAKVRLQKEHSEESLVLPEGGRGYEFIMVLGAVAILFGIFIMIQFQYLFSQPSTAQLQEIGIQSLTYSEYVRKGFFELLIVAGLVIGIISFVIRSLKKIGGKEKILIQTFGGMVVLETSLILWSDFQRLILYAQENGLTRARIIGFIFLVYLAYLLVVMLIELVYRMTQKQLFGVIIPVTLLVLASFTLVNIDGLIATQFKPTVNKEIDYFYITSLSSDTYPVWKEAISDATQTIAEAQSKEKLDAEDYRKLFYVRQTLESIQFQMRQTENKNWQSYNFAQASARSYIADNKETFSRINQLIETANLLDQRVDQNIKSTTTLDRDVTPPLVQ
jgi:hypothetical protein